MKKKGHKKKKGISVYRNLGGTYDNVPFRKQKPRCEYCNLVLQPKTQLNGKIMLQCPNCDYKVPTNW